jgi:hypothetical protein
MTSKKNAPIATYLANSSCVDLSCNSSQWGSVTEESNLSFSKDEIHNVVQRNILDEYNHPQIVEAVSDYLYRHFLTI